MKIQTAVVSVVSFASILFSDDWTPGAEIPLGSSGPVLFDVYLAFNSSTNQMFAAWGEDGVLSKPYFSIFTGN